jgi:hypothetical protein
VLSAVEEIRKDMCSLWKENKPPFYFGCLDMLA